MGRKQRRVIGTYLTPALLGPVHIRTMSKQQATLSKQRSTLIEATIDIVAETGNVVAENGNNVEATFDTVDRIVQLVGIRQCCFDIVASMDGAFE